MKHLSVAIDEASVIGSRRLGQFVGGQVADSVVGVAGDAVLLVG